MKKEKLTVRNKKIMNDLIKHFETVLKVDILEKSRYGIITSYRALFNSVLHRRHQIKYPEIAEFYKTKGITFDRGTIRNSVSKFNVYSSDHPELFEVFKELTQFNKRKKDNNIIELTPIQDLVSNLTDEENLELIELITLRKQSWNWKSKNVTKIYTAV